MILKVKGWKTYISANDNHSILSPKPPKIKYPHPVVLNTWLHIEIMGKLQNYQRLCPTPEAVII